MDITTKSTVMGYISGGTLALGALSLTVMAYSFSEIHSRGTTVQKAPYRRLALVASLITPLSLTDAFASTIYILTKATYSFEVSLAILYVIIVGLIILVNLWTHEEFQFDYGM